MDLLWRVVASVLVSGRSHSVRCAFDQDNDRLIIHDDTTPCERRRIVGWSKLGRAFVSPEMRERQDAAIAARDIYTLRKDAGAAVHRACERIRIVTQDADSARSVHILWSSKVFTSGERVAVTYGPRAPFREGMTMLVTVSSAITPWMRHLRHFFPFIVEDPSLWDDTKVHRNLSTAHHAVETPVREALLAHDISSPLANVVSPLPSSTQQRRLQERSVNSRSNNNNNNNNNFSIIDANTGAALTPGKCGAAACDSSSSSCTSSKALFGGALFLPALADPCCACSRHLPPSLVVFVESCNDIVCVECATACARYYAEVSTATTVGCPCPAARCQKTLAPHELRPLLSAHEWDALEVNEMRLAVEGGITCPSCRMVFDGVKIDTVKNDPLANRFVCSMCETSFCVSCGLHPFHDGRPCRDTAQKGQPKCRYCANPAAALSPTPVCADPVCVDKSARACTTSKACGHLCHGTRGEHTCCSCLTPGCCLNQEAPVDVTCDDLCAICYVETLGEAPCLELACGHVFHTACLEARLEHKWPTAAVSYRFLDCPLCTRPIAHQLLAPTLAPLQKARDALESRYVERLRIEGLLDHPAITTPGSSFFNAPMSWARQSLTYFECFHCRKPYFGGIRGCGGADLDQDPEMENPPRDQLVCAGCALRKQMQQQQANGNGGSSFNDAALCKEHGTMFLEYKCKYCCNLAVWFCWGTTHFCDMCHNPPRKSVRLECPGEELCPIQGRHPPNGTEFLLGCAVCRSKKLTEHNNNNGGGAVRHGLLNAAAIGGH